MPGCTSTRPSREITTAKPVRPTRTSETILESAASGTSAVTTPNGRAAPGRRTGTL